MLISFLMSESWQYLSNGAYPPLPLPLFPSLSSFLHSYMFPTMTQLAEQVEYMADHFQSVTVTQS